MRKIAWIILLMLTAHGQSLDELLSLIDKENHYLKSFDATKLAFEYEGEANSYLENPKLSTSYYANEIITANGAQKLIFSATQNLPWFGILDAKKEVYFRRAKTVEGQYDYTREQLRYNVKSAYFTLAGIQKKRSIFTDYKQQLALYLESTLSKYQSGKGTQLDVINVQTEISFIDQKLMSLEDDIEMQLHMINHRINRFYNHIDAIIPEIELPNLDQDSVEFNFESQILELKKSEISALINLEEKKSMPDFSLGLLYHHIEKSDAFGIQLSIEIPLWSGANDQKIESFKSQQNAFEYQKKDILTKANHNLKRYYSRKAIYLKRLIHIENTLKPQANLAYTTSLISYENGKIDLITVLNSKRLLNELEISQTQIESAFWINESQIEFLLSGSERK